MARYKHLHCMPHNIFNSADILYLYLPVTPTKKLRDLSMSMLLLNKAARCHVIRNRTLIIGPH